MNDKDFSILKTLKKAEAWESPNGRVYIDKKEAFEMACYELFFESFGDVFHRTTEDVFSDITTNAEEMFQFLKTYLEEKEELEKERVD